MALSCLRRRDPELDPHGAYPRYFRSIHMDVLDDFPQNMTLHEFHLLRMNHFKHLPLNTASSEIRLVRIEKSTDNAAPVALTLKHATLNSDLKFTALSYVWGTDASAYPVIIRDSISEGYFLIKRNLWEFFLEARKSTADWSNEWFWIDQVCIDQLNNKERCHQVNQMGLLYSSAQTTISWLNDLGVFSGRPSKSKEPIIESQKMEVIRSTPRYGKNSLPDSTICLLENCSYVMLWQIMKHPYWRRLWIIQEIVLSSHACVLISDWLWDLKDFKIALWVLYVHLKQASIMRRQIMRTIQHIDSLRRMQQTRDISHKSKPTWNDVLEFNYLGECSEPLDRVYAVMGLLREELRVQPDYTISTNQLLKRVLEKQMMDADGDAVLIRTRVAEILHTWRLDLRFDSFKPAGWRDPSSVYGGKDTIASMIKIEINNLRLVVRELGLPDPYEVHMVDNRPDQSGLRTLSELNDLVRESNDLEDWKCWI